MRYRKFFAQIRQRGQMLVLFALMIPIILLFVGLALDLGWYYFNVSRLQNAADAAALAGAKEIQDKSEAALGIQYYVDSLAGNKLPLDFDHYENVFKNSTGTLNNYRKLDDPKDTRGIDLLRQGRAHVEEYTRKNLADSNVISADDTAADWKVASATDGWSISAADEDKQVTGSIELKYKLVDGKNDKHGQLYYVVTLRENIKHFFLPGWFDNMNATVKAVVLLEPHDSDLLSAMWALERTKVMDNWEYQNYYKGTDGFYYAGKWNHYQAGKGSDKTKGIKYSDGDSYRTESVVIKTQDRTKDSTSNGIKTDANGKTFYDVNTVDSINIDFRAEILKKFTTDWDLGQTVTGQSYDFTEGWSATNGADKRILFNAEFDEAFPTRDATQLADVLWTRIESDPIKDISYIPGKAGHTSYNSVRQITLNFSSDNTATYTSGENKGHYIYRPYCVFYTGPENIDYAKDSNGVQIRHSQPVVVNLNANLNAILFMPNSAVVINGNGFDWTGFVIAKCFLTTVTSSDMTSGATVMLTDGYTTKTLTGNYTAGTDSYGNTVYVARKDLYTREQLDSRHPQSTMTYDTGGNLSVYEKIKAPQYILLDLKKDDFEDCTTAAEFYDKFASIVNSTYKDKFKTFSGLDDSQITAVTFPAENYNFTDATYYVATDDLSSTATDSNYVKVLLPDGTTQYVSKNKLPYVKVRTDKEYFYVCVYDLKLTGGGGKGVRMIDGSYTDEQLNSTYDKISSNVTTTEGDLFVNRSNIYGDSWEIDRTWYNGQHNNWKKNELEFAESHGVEYFMLKSEVAALPSEPQIIATYRKVTVGEDTLYFKEGTTYYTKVQNNAHNANNYIIVDENGNILTKSLDNATRPTNANEQPLDKLKIGDRAYEVVYKKEAFNLRRVEYSSFAVPELKRKIYKYLDDGGSVDMFFTTIRAGWVD